MYSELVDALDELRVIVMANAELMAAFTSARTDGELFALALAVGRERGLEITDEMLKEAAVRNHREYLERWILL